VFFELRKRLQVFIFIGEWSCFGLLQLQFVLLKCAGVDLNFRRSEGRSLDKGEIWLVEELSCEPEERLLEVVVALCGDVVVLKVLLSVESNLLGLHLSILDINLVTAKNNRDVFANANNVSVPVGDVLVGHTRSNVEHDDGSISLDVVTVTKTSKLLLSSSIPHIEANLTAICVELERMDLNTDSSNVFLLEFSSNVSFNEGGLSCATISDEDQLKCGHGSGGCHFELCSLVCS